MNASNHTLYLFIALVNFIFLGGCKEQNPSFPPVERFIFIGVDGLSTDGVQKAHTPFINQLIKEGVSSMHARAVYPTSSGPNWGAMLLGAGPEQHGIFNNDWRVNNFQTIGTQLDEDGFFPSIFDIIREKYPDAKLGCIHDWGTIKELFNNKSADQVIDSDGTDDTIDKAIQFIEENNPLYTFIHLDEVDHYGHQDGHGSDAYYTSITRVDAGIGRLIEKLEALGWYEDTYILLSADHGGINFSHGGTTMEEMEIPWIFKGPEIRKNVSISTPIDTYDSPATTAYVLGISLPEVWISRAVKEAFEGNENDACIYIPKPWIKSNRKKIDDPIGFTISTDDSSASIYYSLLGNLPDSNSQSYNGPVSLKEPGFYKLIARSNKGTHWSVEDSLHFAVGIPINDINLLTPPAIKYSEKGAISLGDGLLGKLRYGAGHWLGFQEGKMEAILDLGEIKLVNGLQIGNLKYPSADIDFPEELNIAISNDGKRFKQLTSKSFERSISKQAEILRTGASIGQECRYIRVSLSGSKESWLFVDEITLL